MTTMSPYRRWLAVAAVTTTVTTLCTGPAGAAPPRKTVPAQATAASAITALLAPAELKRMEQQRPLIAAASTVRWEIERHNYSGYAGISLGDSDVALWWKGAVPGAMRRIIAEASTSAPVRVHPAAYSMAELRSAASRLRASWPGGGDAVQAIKLQPDGSGLLVSVAKTASVARTNAAVPDVGVPVALTSEAALAPTSRDDDWAPWKGGATIVNPDQGTACTSGFGVRNGSASYILTAAHCGQAGQRFQDPTGEYIGTIGPRNQDHDVELVPTSGVDGYVYVGNPTANVAALVGGWDWTFVGEYLCQSGVTSSRELGGPVCNLKILFYYADREDLVEAEQTDGQPAARPGDSGGPLYSIAADGKVIAAGTTTRTAGSRIGFQDYGTAWRDFGGITPATR